LDFTQVGAPASNMIAATTGLVLGVALSVMPAVQTRRRSAERRSTTVHRRRKQLYRRRQRHHPQCDYSQRRRNGEFQPGNIAAETSHDDRKLRSRRGQQTILAAMPRSTQHLGGKWNQLNAGASRDDQLSNDFVAGLDVDAVPDNPNPSTPAGMTINSLRFNSPGAYTINTAGDLPSPAVNSDYLQRGRQSRRHQQQQPDFG